MNPNRVRNTVINLLRAEGFHLLEYRSHSSSSIYIKPDAGIFGSIRIADHEGKSHLSYTYTINTSFPRNTRKQRIGSMGNTMTFVSADRVLEVIDELAAARKVYIKSVGETTHKDNINKIIQHNSGSRGFWSKCESI